MTSVRATPERSTAISRLDRGVEQDDPAEHLVGAPGERLEALARASPRRPACRAAGRRARRRCRRRAPAASRRQRRDPACALRRAFSITTSLGLALARAPRPPGRRPRTRSRAARGSRAAAARPRRGSGGEAIASRRLRAEPDRDLALGRLVGVRAVDEVEGDLEPEVAADRARARPRSGSSRRSAGAPRRPPRGPRAPRRPAGRR